MKTVNYRTFGPCNSESHFESVQTRYAFIDYDQKIDKHRASIPSREASTSPVTNQWAGIQCRRHNPLKKFLSEPGENSVGFAAALSGEICSRSLRSNLPIECFFEFRAVS